MFSTPRRFIKTGIGFLGVGLALGGWILVNRELRGVGAHPYLVSAHVHSVGVGFVMFLILGVAQWLFPRASKGDSRYRPERVLVAYWVLTIGTAVRVGTEIARVSSDAHWLRLAVLGAGLAQVVGLAIYFNAMWSRIRPVGSAAREAAGERF